MSKAFTEVIPGIWRWDGVDVDHGFPIVGYMTNVSGKWVLIDPPKTSGSKEEILAIGTPEAILLTNAMHVRGAVDWATAFNILIHAPESATSEVEEYGGKLDVAVKDHDDVHGWKAVHYAAEQGGAVAFDEIAYWHEASGTLIIGDLVIQNDNGELKFGPAVFAGVDPKVLEPITDRLMALKPRVILSAHLGLSENPAEILNNVIP